MAPKGIRGLFSHHLHHDHHHDHHHGHPATAKSLDRYTISEALMEDTISTAEFIISKWDIDTNDSIFYSSSATASGYGHLFLRSTADLHRCMTFLSSSNDSIASPAARAAILHRIHSLLDSAMRRLEREFRLLLSLHHQNLHPLHYLSSSYSRRLSLSSDEDENKENEDDAVGNLRLVAEAMIVAGYGKECVRVYKTIRRSAIEDAINELGFRAPSHVLKLEWEALEPKIRSWLAASRSAMTVFSGERLLCDQVFASSKSASVRESCFADIVCSTAASFLSFPEFVVSKSKRSAENLFQFLDLHDASAELWLDIQSIFSSEHSAGVRTQALNSVSKLAEAARSCLENFEHSVQKDSSKTPVPGGGIHPLTSYVMNCLVILADYELAFGDIYAGIPFDTHAPLLRSFLDEVKNSAPSPSFLDSPIAPRIAWLLLVLLCKLNEKADLYSSVPMSYIFLANNFNYIIAKVRNSRLIAFLGDEWTNRQAKKADDYASSYVRLAWGTAAAAIPSAHRNNELGKEEAAARMVEFNAAFEVAHLAAVESDVVAADREMREEIRATVAEIIVVPYTAFYDKWRQVLRGVTGNGAVPVVRFSPEDVRTRIFGLFDGPEDFGSSRSSFASLGSRQFGHGSVKSRLSRRSHVGSLGPKLSRRSDDGSSSVGSGFGSSSVRTV